MAPLPEHFPELLGRAAGLLAEASTQLLDPRKTSSSKGGGGSRGGGSGAYSTGGSTSGTGERRKKKLSPAMIVGIVLAILALVALYLCIWIFRRRRRGKRTWFIAGNKQIEKEAAEDGSKVTTQDMKRSDDGQYLQRLEAAAVKREKNADGSWAHADGDARTLRPSTETAH